MEDTQQTEFSSITRKRQTLTPVTFNTICDGRRHTVSINAKGQIRLCDHEECLPDPHEQVAVSLGKKLARCYEYFYFLATGNKGSLHPSGAPRQVGLTARYTHLMRTSRRNSHRDLLASADRNTRLSETFKSVFTTALLKCQYRVTAGRHRDNCKHSYHVVFEQTTLRSRGESSISVLVRGPGHSVSGGQTERHVTIVLHVFGMADWLLRVHHRGLAVVKSGGKNKILVGGILADDGAPTEKDGYLCVWALRQMTAFNLYESLAVLRRGRNGWRLLYWEPRAFLHEEHSLKQQMYDNVKRLIAEDRQRQTNRHRRKTKNNE